MFRLLASRDLRFDAIVKDKAALVAEVRPRNAADPASRYQENELYDDLVAALFARPRDAGGGGAGESVEARVRFSRRGKRDRTRALAEALARAEVEFERVHGLARTPPAVTAAAPAESGGLQAVDYFLWAVQRFYELGEDRCLRLVRPQVGEIHDLDADGGAGRMYARGEPLAG